MPLNFFGHILPGDAKALFIPINEAATPGHATWEDTILGEIKVDPSLAHWWFYRMTLYPYNDIGSAESVVLRTAAFCLIETLYTNWESVVARFPAEKIEAAIRELQAMSEISKEYPVMVWDYLDEGSPSDWVSRTMAKLPSIESITEFYELPHIRNRFINLQNNDWYGCMDREAEKAYRRALADRNRRLNRAAREASRGRKNQQG